VVGHRAIVAQPDDWTHSGLAVATPAEKERGRFGAVAYTEALQ
jgi:hypothetical protein